jgi:hypothetical protein
LNGHRNQYKDEVLLRLHEVLPPGLRLTVLADRGFGDQQISSSGRLSPSGPISSGSQTSVCRSKQRRR